MARTRQDARLSSRSARSRLKERRDKGGTWIARHYAPETGRRYAALGIADDLADADGVRVLSFAHAQERAREWFKRLAQDASGEVASGTCTVEQAMADYLADYKAGHTRGGGKGLRATEAAINALILLKLAAEQVFALTTRDSDGIAGSSVSPRMRRLGTTTCWPRPLLVARRDRMGSLSDRSSLATAPFRRSKAWRREEA
jgi:hypothetical protein